MFIVIYRGNITSRELVVKDVLLRDILAQQDRLLCFKIEAARVITNFPCLIIYSILDYCNLYKNNI